MSTVAVPPTSSATKSSTLSALDTKEKISSLATTTTTTTTTTSYDESDFKRYEYKGISMESFYNNSQNLALTFSQVPWMNFNIVATPDMTKLAADQSLRQFVRDTTSITVQTVAADIHKQVTEQIQVIINEMTSTIEKRMEDVHESIMQEILLVHGHNTATHRENLAIPPYERLWQEMCSSHSGGQRFETVSSATKEAKLTKADRT